MSNLSRGVLGIAVSMVAAAGCGEPCNDSNAPFDIRGQFSVVPNGEPSGECANFELPSVIEYTVFGLQAAGCTASSSSFGATCALNAAVTCGTDVYTLDVLMEDDLDSGTGVYERQSEPGAAPDCSAQIELIRF